MKNATSGALIALCLLVLGLAVTQRDLSGNPLGPLRLPAAQFVVTNAHDAGPGTLRDAILAADRLSSRAHVEIAVERITIESALPALTNPHGVDLDARANAGTIDAEHLTSGAVLQLNSPASTVRGLRIRNPNGTGVIVNAASAVLDSLTVSDSKVGILLAAAASGSTIRGATFEHDETAVLAEPGIRDLTLQGDTFRGSSRAGFWFVSAAVKAESPPRPAADAAGARERARIVDSTFIENAAGVVLANQATLVEKSHFTGNHDSAVLVLGGEVRIEDCEIRATQGTAISVTSGRSVHLVHNTLADNTATAVMARDSDVTIEHNELTHNGAGIVAIVTGDAGVPVIRDNTISGTAGDAIVVIGGAAVVERNQVLQNHGAALRVLDLATASGRVKADPHLAANVFKGNGIDTPVAGVYPLKSAP
jgi:hypothetical protein